MAYPQDLNFYVYAPEIGLQKRADGVNHLDIKGTSYIIKFKPLKAGIINISNAPVPIGIGIHIVREVVGMPNIYIAKTRDIQITDPWFDFTHKVYKIKGMPEYRLNNIGISMYSDAVTEDIIRDFVTTRHGEILKILKDILNSKDNNGIKNRQFTSVLRAVIELGDNFFEVIAPYEETYLKPSANTDTDKGKGDTGNGTNGDNGKNGSNENGNGSNTSSTTKTVIGLSALAIALMVMRKKRKRR